MSSNTSLERLESEGRDASALLLTARQEEILDVLETIFRSEGFRALTIGDLAQRLSCSRSTLYAIAATKEELLLLVVDRLLQHAGSEGEARARGLESPSARLDAYLEGTVAYFTNVRRVFMRDVLSYAATRRVYEGHQNRFVDHLRRLVEAGIDAGEFSTDISPHLAAEALDGAMSRLRESRFLREQGMDAGEAFRQLSTLFRRGLDRTERTEEIRNSYAHSSSSS